MSALAKSRTSWHTAPAGELIAAVAAPFVVAASLPAIHTPEGAAMLNNSATTNAAFTRPPSYDKPKTP